MSDLANGILVQHVTLGVGKVVAIEPYAVHVFFPAAEKRFATKLRLPDAHALLRTEGVTPDPWLQGLSAFALDPETRRYALAASWLTHEQAIAQFVAAYPDGFADPRHAGPVGPRSERAPRWRAGAEAWAKTLGSGEGERLAAAGNLRELAKRALTAARHAAPLLPEDDAEGLGEAFADPGATALFFERLFELVGVPSPSRARFDRLFAAATGLAPGAAWTLATVFPFLAQPERQIVVLPGAAREAARRLGCDLRWDDAPNWATYSAFRNFATKLLEELRPLGARDLVDVETFLHATASARAKPKAKPAGTAAPRSAAKVAPKSAAKPTPAPKPPPKAPAKPAAHAKVAARAAGEKRTAAPAGGGRAARSRVKSRPARRTARSAR